MIITIVAQKWLAFKFTPLRRFASLSPIDQENIPTVSLWVSWMDLLFFYTSLASIYLGLQNV